MKIYDRVYELCRKSKLTGKELGEKLNLKKSPMTDWKNEKAQPTVEQIIKMCEIFAVSSEYLLFGKEKQNLTIEEQKLLEAYRLADSGMKAAARKLLDVPEQEIRSSAYDIGKEAM